MRSQASKALGGHVVCGIVSSSLTTLHALVAPPTLVCGIAELVQPVRKPVPPVKILPNITGLRTDDQLQGFLAKHKEETVSPLSRLQACMRAC